MRDLKLFSTFDLHLFNYLKHSSGGIIFLRYLIKGLNAILEEANSLGSDHYEHEYEIARADKKGTIDN